MGLQEALREFAEKGYARVGRVDDSIIDALSMRVDDLMLARVVHPGMFFQLDAPSGRYEDLEFGRGWQGPSLEYRKLEKLELDPLFKAYVSSPVMESIARSVIDGPISLYRAVVFNKSARGGSELPWHQDGGAFWGLDRSPTLQVWTALDDCPNDGGCLEVVPGSHIGGLTTKEGGVILASFTDGANVVPLPAERGEVMLVHNHLWHRSRSSRSGQRRATLSICFMRADTRCVRKKRAPRQFMRVFE